MLTSSSAASVVTSASTPARSCTGTRTSHSSSGCADATRAGCDERRCARSSTDSSAPRSDLSTDVAHVAEPGDQAVEHLDDGTPVLGADVGPDARMAGRDAGHVAKAAGGETQQRSVFLGSLVGEMHQASPRSGGERVTPRPPARRDDRAAAATTSAPSEDTMDRTEANASSSVAAVGVSTHTAPSNRSASAPSTPSCSDPAIGWPPTNRGRVDGIDDRRLHAADVGHEAAGRVERPTYLRRRCRRRVPPRT